MRKIGAPARRLSWWLRRAAAAILLAAGVTVPAVAAHPLSAAAAGAACPGQSPDNTAILPGYFAHANGTVPRPVVLVHGWDSGSSAMEGYARLLDTSKLLHEPLHSFLFDYSANSGQWAAMPAIASCLADYVNAVSAAYRSAGGDGKVLSVGHSMGGLAIRFSASSQYAANPDGASLGGVVTIDTPHLGSPWGNIPAAQLQQDWTQFKNGNGLEGLLPWPPGSDAQVCLASRSGSAGMPHGCATPAWLPASVPVAEIAGDITVHRQVLGFDVADSNISGDAVVSTASSLGYLPDSGPGAPPAGTAAPATYVDDCEVTSGQLEAGVGGLGISVLNSLESALEYAFTLGDRPLSSPVQTLLTLADLTAPCGHTHINNPATDPFASVDVLKALNADLDRLNKGLNGRNQTGTPSGSTGGPARYTSTLTGFTPAPQLSKVWNGTLWDGTPYRDALAVTSIHLAGSELTLSYTARHSGASSALSEGTSDACLVLPGGYIEAPSTATPGFDTPPLAGNGSYSGTLTFPVLSPGSYVLSWGCQNLDPNNSSENITLGNATGTFVGAPQLDEVYGAYVWYVTGVRYTASTTTVTVTAISTTSEFTTPETWTLSPSATSAGPSTLKASSVTDGTVHSTGSVTGQGGYVTQLTVTFPTGQHGLYLDYSSTLSTNEYVQLP